MKIIPFTRVLTVLGLVCAVGLAPALAQSATSTATQTAPGTMIPVQSVSAARTVAKIPRSLTFTSAAAAVAHCPNDVVVWSTLSRSHSFHLSGSRYYGTTKHGAYVCKGDALAAGFHQAKS